jgi:tetratricopeptide (TPR) repeat protein
MIFRYATVAILLLTLYACSSGKKAYTRGDYYEAVMKSVTRLRSNPDHAKSIEALTAAYPLAIEYYETQAKNEIATNSPYKWKNAIQSYTAINQMYEAIRQCPSCLKAIKNPTNYYSEVGKLKENAAEESYNAGIALLMKGTRNDAKSAYYNFQDANNFVPNYKDVVEYMAKAKDDATLKVIIEQIPVPTRYALSGGFFQDKIEEFVHRTYNTDKSFIHFYTPQAAQLESNLKPDQIMRIQFDDFTVGNTTLREKEETVTKDSVKVGEAKVEGKTIPVYNTVKAKLTTYQKEVRSSGVVSMIIVDARTNGILTHRKFSDEYVWVNQWARFNGDERALTDKQLALCKLKEVTPPIHQDLFLEFAKPIYNKLTPSVQDFYRNY